MKDETTGSEKDELQKSGQTSSGKGGSTSKDKGKTYTEAEIAKIKSDAAAEAGRQRKAAEIERDQLKSQLQSLTARLDDLESERNESRLAEARNDPDKLRTYQTDQNLSRRQRELDDKDREITRRELQLKEDIDQLTKDKGTVTVAYVAAKHGIDRERLEKLGITDQDTLEKIAEEISAGKGTAKTGEEDEGGSEEEWNPDTGEGAGGVDESLSTENVEDMSMKSLEKQLEKSSD